MDPSEREKAQTVPTRAQRLQRGAGMGSLLGWGCAGTRPGSVSSPAGFVGSTGRV